MSLASMSCEAPEPQGPASDLGEEETTLESVPDALLGRVFAQITDKITLSSLSLVCKRFRRVLYSDAPEQWHTLRLETSRLDFLTARAAVTPQTPPTCRHADPPASPTGRQQRQRWFAGKRRLLERVGGQVAALAVHDRTGMLRSSGHGAGGGWDLAALLGLLRPGVLADMELEVHPAPPLAALEMLPLFAGSLTALNLDAPQMPATVAALLPALCGLRHLRLAGQHLPEGAVGAAAGLDALTRLELESGFLPLPPLAPLTRLRRLRRLRVMDESQREEPLQVPPPSAWPAGLEALTLFMCSLCQVEEARVGFLNMLAVLEPREHAQAQLAADCRGPQGRLGSLGALCCAVLPPGAPLRSMHLQRARLGPGDVRACDHLSSLTQLQLSECRGGGSEGGGGEDGSEGGGGEDGSAAQFEAALGLLLEQAPLLRSLTVASCLHGAVPQCLVQLRGLRGLDLSGNRLASLPEGPYLSEVEEVNVSSNHFRYFPFALELGRRHLTCLLLSHNEWLEVSETDADCWLSLLPGLLEMDLAHTHANTLTLEFVERRLATRRSRAFLLYC